MSFREAKLPCVLAALLVAVIVAALAGLLTACGGGDEPKDERRDTNPPDCQADPRRCV